MFTIRIGNRRIKILNWFIFISAILLIIYILGSLIFLLPIFKKTYNYNVVKENYQIESNVTFKNAWLKCKVTEEYVVSSKDKAIYDKLKQDLIKDGFKDKKDKLVRITKRFGICSDERKEYLKHHKKNYVTFKLNGNKEEKISYGDDYNEEYITTKINNKDSKKITIDSNFNKNKIGEYIITYTLDVSNNYKERLYRKVNVVDEENPVIELSGEKEINLDYGTKFKEPGFKATDNYDGDITNNVRVKNTVNEKKPGTYKIAYKVSDSSKNTTRIERTIIVREKNTSVSKVEPKIEVKGGITYVDGILLVNKKYSLPKDYNPNVNDEALSALKNMQADSKALGLNLQLVSGYRSYKTQENLYNKYVKKDGEKKASTYSAKPGHSEHQTGLAFDVGSTDRSFEGTSEVKWLEENAHLYGFIIRYPKGKTDVTGYIYEPWHIRYLGKETAKKVKESGLSLEEYLGVN